MKVSEVNTQKFLPVSLLFFIVFLLMCGNVNATAQWAKKFSLSCNTCHTVFPRLNTFGEEFLANGYQLESTYKKNWEDQYSINAGGVFLDDLQNLFGVRINLTPFMLETNSFQKDSASEKTSKLTFGNPNWIQGNIVLDRRRTAGAGYGVSLAGGRVAFGVTGPALDSLTLCGTSDIGDGEWHLITIARNRWDGVAPDGFLWLFVDGRLEASGPGPQGDISYPDSAPAVSPADPFLVLGADKYDAGLPFLGWLDELRFTNILRTRVDFPAPTSPYLNDINTAALFHFDEGAGDIAYDTSGFGGGPSSARRTTAGSPPGPEWSVENPFAAWEGTATPSPTPSPTATVTGTLSATPTPSATATPTRTTSPSPTATASLTLTPTPSASPTTTADPSATASSIPTSTTPTSTTTSTSAPTVTSIPSATPGGSALPGDLSLDGLVNVVDLQLCVNVVLGSETDAGIVGRADMNNDSVANVLDIQAIVNLIMIG